MKKGENKKAQVTIFIIVAVIAVSLGILVYMYYPQIKATFGFEEKNPSAFIQDCLEREIKTTTEKLSLQGGSINPEHYFLYGGEKIKYLCYSESYYARCVVQEPMLIQSFESEIKNEIEDEVEKCFDSMEENYEKRGYGVDLKRGDFYVELLPKKISVTFNSTIVLSKDSSEKYDSFKIILNNNLYELLSIANNILEWEARYGEAETTVYMDYYSNLKVEKKKQSDGTTIYILTDSNTKDKFQFASRSIAWAPGYGTGGVY
ncbi:MAG: hypothetical protein ABH804_00405 [archaeon]